MRKLLLVIFLFLSFHISSYAPIEYPSRVYIHRPNPTMYIDKLKVDYKPLIKAIGIIESRCDTNAINVKEGAYGYFQIRKNRLKHYNNLTGKNYTSQDMHNFEKAQEVFLYFVNHDSRGRLIPDKPYDKTAKNWNGSGPMTENYWKLVSAQLNKGQKV
jgi:hypothetical protein